MAQDPQQEARVLGYCRLSQDGNSGVSGVVTFSQSFKGGPTTICYQIKGLSPGAHGFHIHEFGDLSNGCVSAGGHYNPFKKTHGGPLDAERHVGDLGNVNASKDGIAQGIMEDKLVSLIGNLSIFGRSVVVHKDIDDLGKGGHDDSKTTGHAGARLACGFIVNCNKLPNEMELIVSNLAKAVGKAKEAMDLEPVQAICDHLKNDIKNKGNVENEFKLFKVVAALTQVVQGTNVFAKIQIDENDFLHVRIWKKLDHTSHVTKVIPGKKKDDELRYF